MHGREERFRIIDRSPPLGLSYLTIRPSSIESRPERRSVSGDGVFGSLIRPPRNRSKQLVY